MLLFLSDVAGSEILLILVFVLMFFGSKSIPGLARTMGRTIRQIKEASNELQQEIKKSGVDIKRDLNLTSIIEETAQDIQRPLQQHARDLDEAMRFQSPVNMEEKQRELNEKSLESMPKNLQQAKENLEGEVETSTVKE
jgi:sec-independent protein translocase protein TatA